MSKPKINYLFNFSFLARAGPLCEVRARDNMSCPIIVLSSRQAWRKVRIRSHPCIFVSRFTPSNLLFEERLSMFSLPKVSAFGQWENWLNGVCGVQYYVGMMFELWALETNLYCSNERGLEPITNYSVEYRFAVVVSSLRTHFIGCFSVKSRKRFKNNFLTQFISLFVCSAFTTRKDGVAVSNSRLRACLFVEFGFILEHDQLVIPPIALWYKGFIFGVFLRRFKLRENKMTASYFISRYPKFLQGNFILIYCSFLVSTCFRHSLIF